jgi:hypothetical protein
VGPEDIYEFRLVADTGQPPISTGEWPSLWHLLAHMQPARSVALEGDPPRSILVQGYGGIEVATGLLRSLERFAGTTLHVEVEASVARRAGPVRLPPVRPLPRSRVRSCRRPEAAATWPS